mmetsp:Transcript_543/g.1923  ORF Transcript_543/g.1923 Transcript_543/m.1923 type:complete len:205 (+) Transcript_543:2029-2643(+)
MEVTGGRLLAGVQLPLLRTRGNSPSGGRGPRGGVGSDGVLGAQEGGQEVQARHRRKDPRAARPLHAGDVHRGGAPGRVRDLPQGIPRWPAQGLAQGLPQEQRRTLSPQALPLLQPHTSLLQPHSTLHAPLWPQQEQGQGGGEGPARPLPAQEQEPCAQEGLHPLHQRLCTLSSRRLPRQEEEQRDQVAPCDLQVYHVGASIARI